MTNRKTQDLKSIGQTPLSAVPTLDGQAEEPMTDVQAAKLREMTEQLGEPFDAALTRRQAAARLRELEAKLR